MFHRQSKHILAKYHSVREHVKEGRVVLQQCDTKVMAADMLTKSVTPKVLAVCMKLVGLIKSG